jgi:hypothetical protein
MAFLRQIRQCKLHALFHLSFHVFTNYLTGTEAFVSCAEYFSKGVLDGFDECSPTKAFDELLNQWWLLVAIQEY